MFSLHPPHKHSAARKRKMRIVQIGCVGLGSFVHILCAFSACRIATHRRRQAQPCCRHPSGLYRDPACLSMCSSDIAGCGKQMENKSMKTRLGPPNRLACACIGPGFGSRFGASFLLLLGSLALLAPIVRNNSCQHYFRA